ncbi:MAG: hypothetical protein EA387_12470 [Nitriliruptor sp.]|nr:MAG: hypothetical protein EA387_12470 [Nitriliruptor sp.]
MVLLHPEGAEQWLLQVRIHGRVLPGAIAARLSYWGSNWEDPADGEANLDRFRALEVLEQEPDPGLRFGLHRHIPPGPRWSGAQTPGIAVVRSTAPR